MDDRHLTKRAAARPAAAAMERAMAELKGLILRGELGPGEQIRQEEMAARLDLSRVPLREAMNVLADQGLLFHRPNCGYFVVKRAPGEHAQIRRMLHLLENELMLTLLWPDAATIARLRALNLRMRSCARRVDVPALIDLNREFHFEIFTLSPNRLILQEVARLWSMIEPAMWIKFNRAEDREQTFAEHDRVIAALVARDRRRCAAEMERHRYSLESGLPIELPGAVPETPATELRGRRRRH